MPDIGWLMFLAASWMLGHSIYVRLAGSGLHWMPFSEQGQMTASPLSTEGLRFLFRQNIALWLGVLLLTSAHYALSWLLLATAGPAISGVSTLQLTGVILILLAMLTAALLRRFRRLTVGDDYRPVRHRFALFKHRVMTWTAAIWLLLIFLYAVWLFYSSFYSRDGMLHAGATVHSDLGPHTALISSFTLGQNIPAGYPHFSGDGIRYHFFFYYFAAILNQLGADLVTALNIPSILAFVSMLSLIGLLAWRITGRAATVVLAPLFTLFRSSWAWLTDIFEKGREWGWFSRDFFRAISSQMEFIGDTPRDSWGIWSINVFANQRHLALGISLLLVVLLLALPDIERGIGVLPREREKKLSVWWSLTKKPQIWLQTSARDRKRHLLMAVILILMPFWHGAMTLAALLILLPLTVFAASRLTYVILAGLTTASALLTARLFSTGDSILSWLALDFGLLLDGQSVGSVLLDLVKMLGPLLPIVIIAFAAARRRTRLFLLGAAIPLLFALCFRLTPDRTVNHKFVEITIILWNIIAAESLVRLYRSRNSTVRVRTLAVVTALLLTVTGVYEHRIFHNINSQLKVSITADTEVNRWVLANTEPGDIFLTGPYAFHSFLLNGRPIWYGHGYYAWSAGHDTQKRDTDLENLFRENDPDVFARYVLENDIAWLLVDRSMRERYPDLKEVQAAAHFAPGIRFEDADDTVIYRLKGSAP